MKGGERTDGKGQKENEDLCRQKFFCFVSKEECDDSACVRIHESRLVVINRNDPLRLWEGARRWQGDEGCPKQSLGRCRGQ